MLPLITKEKLADFIDVFYEKGYFSVDETNQILSAGKKYGLVSKVHVNQFNSIGGIEIATKNSALSVDHLEVLADKDLSILKDSETMPVALPSCSFFLGIPFTPARKIIDANLPIALATDYNPGTTPTGNMNFVVSLACIKMKMTPEETINAAFAMNLEAKIGSISVGKLANFFITKPISSYTFLPYNFGSTVIEQVYLNGIKQD